MAYLKLIISIAFFVFSSKTFATSQVGDILIYNGDTLSMFANPLNDYPKFDSIKHILFGEKNGDFHTACWRGYIAEWLIIDNQLYLTNIYSCLYYDNGIKADLHQLFGEKFKNGKVNAYWVTDNIISPQGKCLFDLYNYEYSLIYEKEVEFEFLQGRLMNTITYDNSKTRQSELHENQLKLRDFIQENIDWQNIPVLGEKPIKVYISFSANEKGQVDSAQVLKSHDERYNNEAIRVVKMISSWDIIYRHGKFIRVSSSMPVVFSKDIQLNMTK
jgi:hypothetical protein